MADEKSTHIFEIDVDYDEAIKKMGEYRDNVRALQNEEKRLKKELEDEFADREKLSAEIEANKINQQQYTEAIRVLNKEVRNKLKIDQEDATSLKALRAQLSNLTKEYDELSREERESAKGQELQDHINAITTEIKDAEYATQRYYRNVGNYPKEVVSLMKDTYMATGSVAKAFEAGAQSAKMFCTQVFKMLLNPVIASIVALTAVVVGVGKAFDNSEERMNRWDIAMSRLSTVLNLVKNLLGELGNAFMWCMEKAIDLAEKMQSAWHEIIGDLDTWTESINRNVELQKDKIALTEREREILVETAVAERSASSLRDKIAQKDKFNLNDRLMMLDTVIRIEEGNARKEKELAEERLRQLLVEASMTENDAEMNQKLAEAKAEVIRADTALTDTTRRLHAQRASMIDEEKRDEEARQKERREQAKRRAEEAKQRAKEEEEALKEAKQKEKEALQMAEDAMLELVKDGFEKQIALTTTKYEREIEQLKERLETEKNLTETAREAIGQVIIAKEQELNEKLRQLQAEQQMQLEQASAQDIAKERERLQAQLQAEAEYYAQQVQQAQEEAEAEKQISQAKVDFIANTLGGLGQIMDQFADDNKAMAKMSKILALAEIAINTGKALVAGIAQAQSVPFPANIGAIATTTTTILAGVASAISTVKSAKFASGGIVTGAGTGTSDSISARLSNGESVNTALATSMFAPIYSALNQMGGGVPIQTAQSNTQAMGEMMLTRAFARGVASLPNPVVSVQEITDTQSRVATIERLATV